MTWRAVRWSLGSEQSSIDPLAVDGQTQSVFLTHQPLQVILQRAYTPRIRALSLAQLLKLALAAFDLLAHALLARNQRGAIHHPMLGKYFQAIDMPGTEYREVTPIKRADLRNVKTFSQRRQTAVDKINPGASILSHDLLDTLQICYGHFLQVWL